MSIKQRKCGKKIVTGLSMLLISFWSASLLGQLEAANQEPLPENRNPLRVGKRDINKHQNNFYSLEKEVALGRQLAAEEDRSVRLVDDPIIVEYINRVGQNIVLHSDAKALFTIKVIDSDEINAFALPGGFIYVNKGVILMADNETELAGPMAHLIAHVAARHATELMSREQMIESSAFITRIIQGGEAKDGQKSKASKLSQKENAGTSETEWGKAFTVHFFQNAEKEADVLGAQYLWAAGYDPHRFIVFFEKLALLEKGYKTSYRPLPVKAAEVTRVLKKISVRAACFPQRGGWDWPLMRPYPPTLDRISSLKELIARFPERGEYTINTSEFNQVKNRMISLSNARTNESGSAQEQNKRPTLRHVLLGRWEGTVQSPQGERRVVVTFERKGDTYAGNISGIQDGAEVAFKEVKLESEVGYHRVTAYTQVDSPQGDLLVKYDLLFQDWTWKGKAEMNIGAQTFSFPVDLRRVDESGKEQKSAPDHPTFQQPRDTGAQPIAADASKSVVKGLPQNNIYFL